jgi:hypothetical protein
MRGYQVFRCRSTVRVYRAANRGSPAQFRMVEFVQLLLLILAVMLSLSGMRFREDSPLMVWAWQTAAMSHSVVTLVGIGTFLGCMAVAGLLHEPLPRIHDEFSYLLMSDTLAHGHVSNPAPPLSEFFDTFHVLMRPVYASKYFPAQGLFLAVGEKLTGHPAVGLWLSSALACAAMCWMLQAWVGPTWALLGGFLMTVQVGVYSYWSQSYWGGMVAALGGALFFGAVRRLWERSKWQNAILLALGLVILANSRPLEGLLAVLPLAVLLPIRLWRERRWQEVGFWRDLVLPAGAVLVLGATATGAYNHAITGSVLKSPYALHEQQYQESPPLIFMPPRPAISYSSFWVWDYYHLQENRLYTAQHKPSLWGIAIARKLRTWWFFYCGILLTPALVLPGLLRGRTARYIQMALLAGLIGLSLASGLRSVIPHATIDILAMMQIGLLWVVFEDFWPRVALATSSLLILEMFFAKWSFPHYFAPAACLVLFLEIEGLRRIWHWKREGVVTPAQASRSERRRASRQRAKASQEAGSLWRGFVLLLPVVCVISLAMRVEARINDWSEDSHSPDRDALPMQDWSLRRVDLEHWLERQPSPQLVFVRYSQRHNVNFEWVYNRADLVHSHLIWARYLGPEHDKLLQQQFPGRIPWVIDADRPEPQLVPYAEAIASSGFTPSAPQVAPEEDRPDW